MKAWQLSLVAVAVASASANAVEANGIMLGSGVTLLPGAEMSVSNNSNVYLTDGDETSSTVTRVRPYAGLNVDLGATRLNANYSVEAGIYKEDSDDNYVDQRLGLGGTHVATSRVTVGANVGLNKSHDDRGEGSLLGNRELDPSEYTELTLGASGTYGANGAFANATVYVESYSKEYNNNEALTDSLNFDRTKLGAEMAFEVSSATNVLVDVSTASISYDDKAGEIKDGSLMKLLVGASWDITGKTTGRVKIGTSQRDFDDSSVDSGSDFSWEANVLWSPKSYSTVTLTTAQTANESTGLGRYVNNSYSAVNWNHSFSTMWALNANLSLNSDEFVEANRQDDTLTYGIKGIYSPMKMVDVTLRLENSTRDSDADNADYDKQIISAGVNLAF